MAAQPGPEVFCSNCWEDILPEELLPGMKCPRCWQKCDTVLFSTSFGSETNSSGFGNESSLSNYESFDYPSTPSTSNSSRTHNLSNAEVDDSFEQQQDALNPMVRIEQPCASDNPPLFEEEIGKLRTIVIDQTFTDEGSVCTICREMFVMDERVLQLPCTHLFQGNCITEWLGKQSGTCPVCRDAVRRAMP